MESIKELFKIGNGPSSSHTMGPKKASLRFLEMYSDCDRIDVTLYGSLALTGKGHLTDYIIKETLSSVLCNIIFDYTTDMPHQNTMKFIGYKNDSILGSAIFYSIGGGSILMEGEELSKNNIYSLKSFSQIKQYCFINDLTLYDYVYSVEDSNFYDFLETIYNTFLQSIERGLNTTGTIPGSLELKRKAKSIYENSNNEFNVKRKICAYAYAVSEENASGKEVVTAPTCGASGVLPAVVKYALDLNKFSKKQIIDALATSGLIGNLIKHNGSISGAVAGCQAEIGSACAMAAAFLAQVNNCEINGIEQASEIALEHHLGLTCDPIKGYVQIPCIERNAVASLRAIDAYELCNFLNYEDSKISLDVVIETMLNTGKDLKNEYKETSKGGLAKYHRIGNNYEK